MTLAGALAEAVRVLGTRTGVARLEAEVLLAQVSGRPRHYPYAHPEAALGPEMAGRYRALVARRAAGEPIAHIVGYREFWSLRLAVTPDVLIPRPETERLVEVALSSLPPGRPARVADLGTGTGAVALAIAAERPAATVLATDVSDGALVVARGNARAAGLGNVSFAHGDWCAALEAGGYDLIVSNPPYVADDDGHLGTGDVRFEPRLALAGGPDGLDAVRTIVDQARRHLAPGAHLALEHGHDQGAAVRRLLETHGYGDVSTHRDLAGHERVSQGAAGVAHRG